MKVKLKDGNIYITDCFFQKEQIKEIPGRKWSGSDKAWIVPANKEALTFIKATMKQDTPKEIDDEFIRKTRLEVKVAEEKEAENNEPIEPMPIKLKPFQHQVKGYNMACMVLGLFEEGGGANVISQK